MELPHENPVSAVVKQWEPWAVIIILVKWCHESFIFPFLFFSYLSLSFNIDTALDYLMWCNSNTWRRPWSNLTTFQAPSSVPPNQIKYKPAKIIEIYRREVILFWNQKNFFWIWSACWTLWQIQKKKLNITLHMCLICIIFATSGIMCNFLHFTILFHPVFEENSNQMFRGLGNIHIEYYTLGFK